MDGEHGAQFFIEDGGYPDLIRTYLDKNLSTPIAGPKRAPITRKAILVEALARLVRSRNPQSFVMPWFAQGMDAADGRLYCPSKDGAVRVVDLTGEKGKIVAENAIGEPLVAPPALDGDALYVRTDTKLWKVAE